MLKVALKAGALDTEGVWTTFMEGVRFRIARAGNSNFLKINDKLEAPYRKQIARGKLSTEKQLEIHCRAMAQGILKDWEGIADETGKAIPYDPDVAADVLRFNSDVRDFVLEFATEQENFRTEEIKETAKKSPTDSGGT